MKREEAFAGIDKIIITLYPSSWGRFQIDATEAYPPFKQYHAWEGRPNSELTLELLIKGLENIQRQINDKENK